MTAIEEWRAMDKSARRQAWQRMTPEQRSDLFTQFAATTPVFGLPYPSDYNDPADSPTAFRELATATEGALSTRVAKTGDTMTGALTAPTVYVDRHYVKDLFVGAASAGPTYHGTIWSDTGNPLAARNTAGTLVPFKCAPALLGVDDEAITRAQIPYGTWDVGTLAAGQEVEVTLSKPSGSAVFVTVQHNSTWIYAVANTLDPTTVRLRCRNGTESTQHTNVKVYYQFLLGD